MTVEELELMVEARELLASGGAAEIRKAASLSQGEVAAFCSVDGAAVSRWESGQRIPRGPAAIRYGRLLRTLRTRVTVEAA